MLGTCLLCYSGIVTFLLILYVFFDVNYFIRLVFTIGVGRLLEKKKKVEDVTTIYGVVTTQDVDIFPYHMNNARFVRDLDFARFHFFDQSGIYDAIIKAKGHALQSATNIRYRRTIPLFQAYKITTKLISWDEKTFYLEQQFITIKDGFVRAVVLSKQATIDVNVPEMMSTLTGKDASYRPAAPEELADWISSIEKSSNRLKKKD